MTIAEAAIMKLIYLRSTLFPFLFVGSYQLQPNLDVFLSELNDSSVKRGISLRSEGHSFSPSNVLRSAVVILGRFFSDLA